MFTSFPSSQRPTEPPAVPHPTQGIELSPPVETEASKTKLWLQEETGISLPFLPICIIMTFWCIQEGVFPTLARPGEKLDRPHQLLQTLSHQRSLSSPLQLTPSSSLWLHFSSVKSVLLLLSFHLDLFPSLSPLLVKQPDNWFSNLSSGGSLLPPVITKWSRSRSGHKKKKKKKNLPSFRNTQRLRWAYCLRASVVGIGDTVVSKIRKHPCSQEAYSSVKKAGINQLLIGVNVMPQLKRGLWNAVIPVVRDLTLSERSRTAFWR